MGTRVTRMKRIYTDLSVTLYPTMPAGRQVRVIRVLYNKT
jgi:hypothetical protein